MCHLASANKPDCSGTKHTIFIHKNVELIAVIHIFNGNMFCFLVTMVLTSVIVSSGTALPCEGLGRKRWWVR